MIQILIAAPQRDMRNALRLLVVDLGMEVTGEAGDWATTMSTAVSTQPDMVVLDWDLTPLDSGNTLAQLRDVCPTAVVIVLISHLNARHQAALSAGADVFISKGEAPNRIAARLRAAAAEILAL